MAEDNLINQKVGLLMLSRLGYAANAVPNGKRALEALDKATYDIILMDIQMPEMNGIEATRLITETYGHKRPVIVALTAEALEGDETRILGLGFDSYLSKPLQPQKLQQVLEAIVPHDSVPLAARASAVTEACCLFLERNRVVHLEPVEQRRGFRLQADFRALAREPFFFLGDVVRIPSFHAFAPRGNFIRGLGRSIRIEPINDLLVSGAGGEQLFHFIGLHAFEFKEHLVERTSEVIFANVAGKAGAALVDGAGEQGITAEAGTGTAGSFLGEVLCDSRHSSD
jgi:CheY-like chemotaxis protein